ncbi:toll/interleukin-1 receptor domain-containing protein [bacterium]|nr:toll/interleukin-1 receptor domain-containing protein [bacterium]MBU1653218.1 toll/interleukin-1 receptor domain-containing protein [bacterium]
MANPVHVEILKKGVKVWNDWRKANPSIQPDLSEEHIPLILLLHRDLTGLNLSYCRFYGSMFGVFSYSGINMSNANLNDANLGDTELIDCDLSEAMLISALFYKSRLCNVNLLGSYFSETKLIDTNLRSIKYLENCFHHGPSTIDFRTLKKSWPLPKKFLRGIGLPEQYIDYLPSLLNQPIEFFTCFISYSRKDEEFVDRLHADLQDKGVRCWLDRKDLPWGEETHQFIDATIRHREKVLLVLSENSIRSEWVKDEVEAALERERKGEKRVIIPFCIDDSFIETDVAWASKLRRQRNIGNFTGWKHRDKYKEAFDDLLKWLRTGEK